MVEKVTVNSFSGSASVYRNDDLSTYDRDHDKPIVPPQIPCQPRPGVHAKTENDKGDRTQDPSIGQKKSSPVNIPANGFRHLAGCHCELEHQRCETIQSTVEEDGSQEHKRITGTASTSQGREAMVWGECMTYNNGII